jgi:hypothetical protein
VLVGALTHYATASSSAGSWPCPPPAQRLHCCHEQSGIWSLCSVSIIVISIWIAPLELSPVSKQQAFPKFKLKQQHYNTTTTGKFTITASIAGDGRRITTRRPLLRGSMATSLHRSPETAGGPRPRLSSRHAFPHWGILCLEFFAVPSTEKGEDLIQGASFLLEIDRCVQGKAACTIRVQVGHGLGLQHDSRSKAYFRWIESVLASHGPYL